MPELPEVSALVRNLNNEIGDGKQIARAELGAIASLKTFHPPLDSVIGRVAIRAERRGKYICVDLDGIWIVTHLSRGGWLKWYDPLPTKTIRPSRGPLALRVGFADGTGFDLTEMGTERRLSIWVVPAPDAIEGVASLGPDPLDATFDADALGEALRTQSGTLKSVLVRQSVLAGVGNAYSDEALHLAKLSPFKLTTRLHSNEIQRLHAALVTVLCVAVTRSEQLASHQLKDDKHQAMRVHGRTGAPCPECGDTIREVWYSTRSFQYCPTCQTGGKPLADRRLSRLLK